MMHFLHLSQGAEKGSFCGLNGKWLLIQYFKPMCSVALNNVRMSTSQLHEDGYTQQALQLEVSTIHSSGNVKASDKLSRLFSSCLSSVTEATSYFNNKSKYILHKRLFKLIIG